LISFNKKKFKECKLSKFQDASFFQVLTTIANKLNCKINAFSSDPMTIFLFSSFGKTYNFTNDKLIVSFTQKDDSLSLSFLADWREFSFEKIANVIISQNNITYKLEPNPYFKIDGKSFILSHDYFGFIEFEKFDINKPFKILFNTTLKQQEGVLFKFAYRENKLFASENFALKTEKMIHKNDSFYVNLVFPFHVLFSDEEKK